jgi:hypothetical protein
MPVYGREEQRSAVAFSVASASATEILVDEAGQPLARPFDGREKQR